MEWINDTQYSCPILMFLQSLIKREQFWQYGSDGWKLMMLPTVCAHSIWSASTVKKECDFWNSRFGIKLRKWCGTQQREYRIKLNNRIDDLLERQIESVKPDILDANFIYQENLDASN
jgi:hypothetical protein